MKMLLKPVVEALNRDANQLEHHAQKLKAISPATCFDLKADAEVMEQMVESMRRQVEILVRWE